MDWWRNKSAQSNVNRKLPSGYFIFLPSTFFNSRAVEGGGVSLSRSYQAYSAKLSLRCF